MTTEEIYIPQATTTEFELTCDDTGLSYELEDEVFIGRDLSCHIRLASTDIAGRHAKISQSEDGIFLEDLAPNNTTLLNGSQIGHGAWITLGDQLDLNGITFSVRAKNRNSALPLAQKQLPTDQQSSLEKLTASTYLKPSPYLNPNAYLKELKETKQATLSTSSSTHKTSTTHKTSNTHKASSAHKAAHGDNQSNLAKRPTQAAAPLTNQDVVEAARALEERAKARLQEFKKGNSNVGINAPSTSKRQSSTTGEDTQPNWESLVTEQMKLAKQKLESESNSPKNHLTEDKSSGGSSEEDILKQTVSKVVSHKDTAIKANAVVIENKKVQKVPAKKSSSKINNQASTEVALDTLAEPEKSPTKELDDFDAANDNLNADEHAKALQAIETPEPETKPASGKRPSQPAVGAGAGPRLVVQTAPTRGKSYHLTLTDAKNTWTIGHAKDVDVQINENAIDGVHAIVEELDGMFKISTTRTTNGMLINEKFKGTAALKHGDIVQFGRMTFQFRTDSPSISLIDTNAGSKPNYGSMIAGLVILGSLLTALLVAPK